MYRSISFGELRIGEQGRKNIQEVLDSNWVSSGPMVDRLEKEWSETFGYKHSIAVGNGTDACTAMFMTLYDYGAERGDEVICPAVTFVATANAILAAGFVPVFADINCATLNYDMNSVSQAVSEKTKAIVVVHLMGMPGPMHELVEFCHRKGFYLFEDCCEAHGAKYQGSPVGIFGVAGAFSCYAAHLVVCGEGGMVVTESDKIAHLVRSIRSHGRKDGNLYFNFERLGLNLKMNDLEAAIGLEQIGRFSDTFEKRTHNYMTLLEMLEEVGDHIYLYHPDLDNTMSPHAFPILCHTFEAREALYKYLEFHGIQCKTLFGSLPTQHAAFKFLGYKLGDFPKAESVGRNGLHFGIHQYLTQEDLEYIALKIIKFFRENHD